MDSFGTHFSQVLFCPLPGFRWVSRRTAIISNTIPSTPAQSRQYIAPKPVFAQSPASPAMSARTSSSAKAASTTFPILITVCFTNSPAPACDRLQNAPAPPRGAQASRRHSVRWHIYSAYGTGSPAMRRQWRPRPGWSLPRVSAPI